MAQAAFRILVEPGVRMDDTILLELLDRQLNGASRWMKTVHLVHNSCLSRVMIVLNSYFPSTSGGPGGIHGKLGHCGPAATHGGSWPQAGNRTFWTDRLYGQRIVQLSIGRFGIMTSRATGG